MTEFLFLDELTL